MNHGFYYTYWPEDNPVSYWGKDKLGRLKKLNVYMDWQLSGKPKLPKLAGRKLWVDLGMYTTETSTPEHVRACVKALRPYWKKIIAFELGDEYKGPKAAISQRARMVRNVVAEFGLPCPPLSMTFEPEDILEGDRWTASGLDVIGFEAYLPAIKNESVDSAKCRMEDFIREQLKRIGKRPVILVGLEFRMSGSWGTEQLVAVQEVIFRIAKELDAEKRLVMLALFSWAKSTMAAKPGECARDIPPLKADLRRRLA